jgi:hypothetical protein
MGCDPFGMHPIKASNGEVILKSDLATQIVGQRKENKMSEVPGRKMSYVTWVVCAWSMTQYDG